MDRVWLVLLAASAAAGLLLPFAPPGSAARATLAAAAILALAAAVALAFVGRAKKGRYDLGELKKVQEREELDALYKQEVKPMEEEVVCLSCHSAFDARLPACPNCGRMQGS